jgi:predicted lactoylglutathione lyase
MELGWCDVCLRVKEVSLSRDFYLDLGFWQVEGSDEEGWAVVTNGDLRLGLFESQYMTREISLNFRGGKVQSICEELKAKGRELESEPKVSNRGVSASLTDPDGHMIFLDAFEGESKKVDPMRRS